MTNVKLFWSVFQNRLKRQFIKNPIDTRIEGFILSVSANDDFKNVLTNKDLATVLAFMVRKLYDLANFQHLYCEIILPQQQRDIKRMNHYSKRSFYLKLLNKPTNFDDSIFEVTRIGYVHLYHKYESFIREICPFLDEYLTKHFKEQISILQFLKNELFGYDLFDLKYQPPKLQKINWVANCVKHYDGFPVKNNPPAQFANADKSQQIKIEKDEFENDILFLLDHFCKIFTLCLFSGYIDFGIKRIRSSTSISAESLKEFETNLKASLLAQFILLTGKFTE
jgi:hypothetical protein